MIQSGIWDKSALVIFLRLTKLHEPVFYFNPLHCLGLIGTVLSTDIAQTKNVPSSCHYYCLYSHGPQLSSHSVIIKTVMYCPNSGQNQSPSLQNIHLRVVVIERVQKGEVKFIAYRTLSFLFVQFRCEMKLSTSTESNYESITNRYTLTNFGELFNMYYFDSIHEGQHINQQPNFISKYVSEMS